MDRRQGSSNSGSNTPQQYVAPRKDDGEDVLQCPLNPEHMILRSRMNRHIMKCKQNYNGVPLRHCPFNFMHLIPAKDLPNHMSVCEDYVKNKKLDDFTRNQVS